MSELFVAAPDCANQNLVDKKRIRDAIHCLKGRAKLVGTVRQFSLVEFWFAESECLKSDCLAILHDRTVLAQ